LNFEPGTLNGFLCRQRKLTPPRGLADIERAPTCDVKAIR
jgi:hypothetical protein